MAEELHLFDVWASPFCRRVELALKLKALKYRCVEEDLKNKSNLLLKYNPTHKKVPVLVHNGKPVAESAIILEYIDENWKANPFLPHDVHERAQARFWAKFIDDKVSPSIVKAAQSRGEEREKAVKEAEEALDALEKELKGKRFFGGERIGLVDIVAISVAHWAPIIAEVSGFGLVSEQKFPNLSKWSEELARHSLVKEVLPPKEKLIPFFRTVFRSNAAAN